MPIHQQTIDDYAVQTIDWLGDAVVDWANAGQTFGLDGQRVRLHEYHFSFAFDRAISSADGTYAFIYQNLGTKGLLLKQGEVVREINRPYYHADVYEYPAAFVTVDVTTYLIHCPVEYCQLDFEHVETGELVTNIPGREPHDFFHSRLEVSPAGSYLLSKGWLWHPWNAIEAFDIRACLANPLLLDATELSPGTNTELNSAAFLTDDTVLLAASGEDAMDDEAVPPVPPGHIAFWNLKTNEFTLAVAIKGPFSNVFPISEKLAWDVYQYPKLIDLETGELVARLETLDTGRQCSSIIRRPVPAVVFNRHTKQLAVLNDGKIEVLSVVA